MSKLKAQRRKSALSIFLISIIVSQTYTMLYDGFGRIYPFINTFIIGILIALATVYFEFNLYKNKIRKFSFPVIIVIRTFYYLIIISGVIFFEIAASRMIRNHLSFTAVLKSRDFQHYILKEDFFYGILYASVIIFIFNFIKQIIQKLGQGALLNVISGKFVKPVQEDRIFMFIKISRADSILDKLGRFTFNAFINDIIYDITESILTYSGEIYEYVDDQIIVSWKQVKGQVNSACIRTFFEAKDQLMLSREYYLRKYGCIPKINAAYHCGSVIHGELGLIKSPIVFTGDVMNTTSRILDQCGSEKSMLVSGSLMNLLELPHIFNKEFCGEFIPKGKNTSVQLYTVQEAELKFQ